MITVLHASEKQKWDHYISQIPQADVYFTASYCEIYEKNGEGKAYMFVYEQEDNYICYPYLLREINTSKLNVTTEETLYDITTPYGYGGPITNITGEQEKQQHFHAFNKLFEEHCRQQNIVTEFVRFHPLIQNQQDYESIEPIFNRNTVYMELQADEKALMDSLRNKGRNRVKFAMKQGLTVTKDDPSDLTWFTEYYMKTMEKNQADNYYFFKKSFFDDTAQLLDENLTLFSVRYNDEVIASAMFMHYNGYVAYHLTGSNQDYLHLAPYQLLVWHAALYFGQKGYKTLHLGGGYRQDDDLLRFKRNLTKTPLLDFYIGKKIHLPEQYKMLTQNIEEEGDFFPLYRHPALVKKTVYAGS